MRWQVRAFVVLGTFCLVVIPGQSVGAQDPAAALPEAERTASELSRDSGLVRALSRTLHRDGVLLWPGAPVVTGAADLKRLLTVLQADSVQLTWQPLGVDIATDSSLGVTWGVAVASTGAGAISPQIGRYIAAWRRDGARWSIAALVLSGIRPLAPTAVPAGIPLTRRPAAASGRSGVFVDADLAFARLAADSGAAIAFERWAAPDAVTFGDRGLLTHGPKAIGRAVDFPAMWRWHPVAAGAAGSSDLGWTVGEATIKPKDGEPSYSKYLTIWVRQGDGRIRFLTDGGNGRPPSP
jgi:hypothetical protein